MVRNSKKNQNKFNDLNSNDINHKSSNTKKKSNESEDTKSMDVPGGYNSADKSSSDHANDRFHDINFTAVSNDALLNDTKQSKTNLFTFWSISKEPDKFKTNDISLGIEDTRELAKSHNIGFVSKSKEIINRSNTNELIDTTSHAK